MNITKEQLKNTVMSMSGDIGFMVSIIRDCFETIPEPYRSNLLSELVIIAKDIKEYFIIHNHLTNQSFTYITFPEVIEHLTTRYPTLAHSSIYSAMYRKTKVKGYSIHKIKKEDHNE